MFSNRTSSFAAFFAAVLTAAVFVGGTIAPAAAPFVV